MPPFNAELIPLPATVYFLGFVNVFVVLAFPCSLCILCAGVTMPVNKRQLCTGSHALDTAFDVSDA